MQAGARPALVHRVTLLHARSPGIQYNTASVSITEDRVYTQGRYYLGASAGRQLRTTPT